LLWLLVVGIAVAALSVLQYFLKLIWLWPLVGNSNASYENESKQKLVSTSWLCSIIVYAFAVWHWHSVVEGRERCATESALFCNCPGQQCSVEWGHVLAQLLLNPNREKREQDMKRLKELIAAVEKAERLAIQDPALRDCLEDLGVVVVVVVKFCCCCCCCFVVVVVDIVVVNCYCCCC
jgi:hypothetical protein